jgi:catechol 2,3-dioxygenase-like lactoylglutathione lyase family enzyme
MFTNPDHVTLAVVDADAAIAFFALLGFSKGHVTTIEPGSEPARFMGMADMRSSHITLTLDGSDPPFEIQLLQFDPLPAELHAPADDVDRALPTNHRERGFNHLAFAVDDIAAATAHLEANGVKILSDEMDYISRKLRFFEGPEGITLEMVERMS